MQGNLLWEIKKIDTEMYTQNPTRAIGDNIYTVAMLCVLESKSKLDSQNSYCEEIVSREKMCKGIDSSAPLVRNHKIIPKR